MKSGFMILHDPTFATGRIFQMEEGIPYNVVLDRSGKVVGTTTGDVAALQALVKRAVANGGPVTKKRARR
jgi:hypothetical protein